MTLESARGWKVLIVDDEPDNVGVAEALLTHHGAEVTCASNGQQGLTMLEAFAPTLILMDLSMPGLDGWQVLKHLRANPRTADIPVIALTAHVMFGDEQRVRDAGFDGYIAKPFPLTSFIDDIKACLPTTQSTIPNSTTGTTPK